MKTKNTALVGIGYWAKIHLKYCENMLSDGGYEFPEAQQKPIETEVYQRYIPLSLISKCWD